MTGIFNKSAAQAIVDVDNFKSVNDTFEHDVGDMDEVSQMAGNICELFRHTYIGEDAEYKISCSIGIAISRTEREFRELFRKADIALYQAKSKGKDCYCFYQE